MSSAWLLDQLKKRYGVAAVVLVLVFVCINADLIFGRAVLPFDAHEFFVPAYMLLADFARAGRFLLWDPWTNGGLPNMAEPQTGSFSPIQLAFGLVTGGSWVGFRIFSSSLWLLSGVGMLWLGRQLGAPAWGALVVAIGYLFSGYHLGHAEHISFIYSFTFLPFSLVLLDRAIERRSSLAAAQAGCLWGLSMLSGYPGMVLNNGALLGLWGLGRGVVFPSAGLHEQSLPLRRRLLGTVALLAVVLLVGSVIMSPVVLGMGIDAAGVSGRVGALPRDVAINSNSLGPLALTTLFSPYLARLPLTKLWPLTDRSCVSLYTGAAITTLALWSLVARPRHGARWALLAVGVLAVLVAVGPALPVRGWLYDWLPPTRYFRHAAIYRGYAITVLAILALLGARDLHGVRARDPRLVLVALGCAYLAFRAFGTVTAIVTDDELPAGRWHGQVVWGAVILVGLVLAVTQGPWRLPVLALGLCGLAIWDARKTEALDLIHIDRSNEARAMWRRLDQEHVAALDLTTSHGLDRAHTPDPVQFGTYLSNRNVVVKKPVLLGYVALKSHFHERWSRDPILSASAIGRDRIWFAPQASTIDPSEPLFERFVARANQLGSLPLVVHTPAAMTGPAAARVSEWPGQQALAEAPAAQRIPYQLLRYEPTILDFDVEAATDGWLLVTDRWAPGWRVTVNDQAVTNFAGDFIFRAVPVSRGPNRVRMSYRPLTFPGLLILSWGTLAGVGLASWLLGGRRYPVLAAQLRGGLGRLVRRSGPGRLSATS